MGIVLPPGLSLTSPASTATAHGSINTHHGGGHNSIIASSQVMRTRSPHSKYRGPQGTLLYLLPEMFLKRVITTSRLTVFQYFSTYLLFFFKKEYQNIAFCICFHFSNVIFLLFSLSLIIYAWWCRVNSVFTPFFIQNIFQHLVIFDDFSKYVPSICFTLEKSLQNCQKFRKKKI